MDSVIIYKGLSAEIFLCIVDDTDSNGRMIEKSVKLMESGECVPEEQF
jgi:hypothetical protein